ncbi:hypothetical protein B9G99_15795 [Kushneria konosiri]|uniref:Uncharacterized protein n=2 Tax=Kushneria konosiri TaxID=698828 RepID=A0A2Z2H9P0_9GAMM|nr:hypothetical protein B9G99_15795 [Kushneria konosiri]
MRRYGGLRGETFGSAGFLFLRFANPVQSVTQLFGDSGDGSSNETGASPMAHHALSASARLENPAQSEIPASQKAIALIGSRLIELRVNRRSEQFAELVGMARMAHTLGAISATDYTDLLSDLNDLIGEGVARG